MSRNNNHHTFSLSDSRSSDTNDTEDYNNATAITSSISYENDRNEHDQHHPNGTNNASSATATTGTATKDGTIGNNKQSKDSPRLRTHSAMMQQQQQIGEKRTGFGASRRSANRKKKNSRRNDDAFSSSSSSGDDDDDDDDDTYEDDDDLSSENDYDDDEEDDSFSQDDDDEDSPPNARHRRKKQNSYGSEFDKALRLGQGPSRGNYFGDETPQTPSSKSGNKTRGGSTTPPPPPANNSSNPSATTNVHIITKEAPTVSSNANQHQIQQPKQQQQQQHQQNQSHLPPQPEPAEEDDPLSSGVLPDVLMTMRQKIESLTLFDSDMMKLANVGNDANGIFMDDPIFQETRESLKRSSQQSISAAVLVSLAHKRYERRRLAAMEIEKVVRSLVQQDELERVRAILLLLSDDYVRSTSEDARKGGVVALAASAIGLKKAQDSNPIAHECRDLILASVVHACQDHSQRVRYYATESLFNVIKVIPNLAVQHFFILFEILRSLFADVDLDVKSGAEMLDKKLKEVIVGAMNSGQFSAEACVPVFARFVYMRNKATKRLTLTWLQELTEKLIGAPILEFLHLFLTGIFDMIADPTLAIRQSALAFLQSVLPKLLDNHVVEEAIDDFQSAGIKVDFDKILQSLVFSMEHPDPMVRKIAMYWMSRIVKAHISGDNQKKKDRNATKSRSNDDDLFHGLEDEGMLKSNADNQTLSAATISVRNALPHILPGILLSIGDTFQSKPNVKDSFLPDVTTHTLADQTNTCLQGAVRSNGKAYVNHLDSFIVALREELDSPGGVNARNPPAVERKPYRMDVKHDGTGIESQGWFRKSNDTKETNIDSMMWSRLCALQWIVVLYESVVPDALKADVSMRVVIHITRGLVLHSWPVLIQFCFRFFSTVCSRVRRSYHSPAC
jgi:Vacuolar 14 Fab1-binding region